MAFFGQDRVQGKDNGGATALWVGVRWYRWRVWAGGLSPFCPRQPVALDCIQRGLACAFDQFVQFVAAGPSSHTYGRNRQKPTVRINPPPR